jgi:ribosomal protein S18 acetylase RimI-like enzyme
MNNRIIIENKNYKILLCSQKDISAITEIYNSNPAFLSAHINKDYVNEAWVKKEIDEMKSIGFYTAVIFEKSTGHAVGFIDYKPDSTVYLSLFMLHGKLKGKGIGIELYCLFEKYLSENKCDFVRIDAVYDYKENAVGFWRKLNFSVQNEVTLNWSGKESQAYLMIKKFNS